LTALLTGAIIFFPLKAVGVPAAGLRKDPKYLIWTMPAQGNGLGKILLDFCKTGSPLRGRGLFL